MTFSLPFDRFKFLLIFLALLFFTIFPKPSFAQEKRVEINLATQNLTAFEDGRVIYSFPISSGKFSPTPKGSFKPWAKVPSQRMTGGNKNLGTYYDLPNVPHVVYFYQGYAIHGAYWHNNFGVPMSHGCVNVHPANMAGLYNWMDYQTLIRIY